MLGADTTILLRAFLEDRADHAKVAQKFLANSSASGELFISSYAILEFAWILKAKKFSRQEIFEAILTLTDSPGVTIGQREVVLAACDKYVKGKADFADYMILSEGEKFGARVLKTLN